MTQDELAKAARRVGLRWTASKVRDFETGRSAPTFATVLALTAALEDVTDQRPRLADLVRFDGDVTVTEDFEPTGEQLTSFAPVGGGTGSQNYGRTTTTSAPSDRSSTGQG